ncbi:MAG: ABC transporter ATP-binding protein, partial [Bacillota bacterium]|nr:ABC transporter ATP-binding protein [Bacillota bacterium]
MKRQAFSRLFSYLKRHASAYAVGVSGEVSVEIAQQLLLAYMVRGLTDAAVGSDFPLLLRVIFFSTALMGVTLVILPLAVRKRSEAVERATVDLRTELFSHYNALPQPYLENIHSGDIVSRLTNDINSARDAFGSYLVQLASTVLVSVVCALYMISVSWKLAALAIALGILPMVFNKYTALPLRRVSGEVQQGLAVLNSRLRDLLTGLPVIRAFNLERRFADEYSEANTLALKQGLGRMRLQSLVSAWNDFFGGLNLIGMLIFATYLIYAKELTPGAAVAAVQLTHNVIRPFHVLGDVWSRLQQSLAGAERVFAVLDEPLEVMTVPQGELPRIEDGVVAFADVHFSYDNQKVLSGISFSAPESAVIAFAGPSGGGKSTIFKLILGFCTPASGNIAVDGHD